MLEVSDPGDAMEEEGGFARRVRTLHAQIHEIEREKGKEEKGKTRVALLQVKLGPVLAGPVKQHNGNSIQVDFY